MAGHSPDELVAVGRVGRPRGVRGHVFVAPWTDDPDVRFAAGALLRTDPAERGPLEVAESSSAGGKLVVRFAGVDDRTAAETLHGTLLLVARADRPRLADPDDFYDTDLIGLAAVAVDGSPLGVVADVVHAPGSDFLVVASAGGPGDERSDEHLVPFVRAIVPTVDLAAGRVVVTPPEGLFEL